MKERTNAVGVVRNPLTVIAVFAGLAEISATIALPQLPPEVQSVFVWFVMLFPTFLVGLFFLLLWKKHQVLYAPSDFSNEDNFMQHWLPDTRTRKQVAAEEIARDIVEADDNASLSDQEADRGADATENPLSRYLQVREAEDLAIKRISRELGVSFARDVAFYRDRRITFDAVAESSSGTVAIEVKRVFSPTRVVDTTKRALTRIRDISDVVRVRGKADLRFILVIVTDFEPDETAKKEAMRARTATGVESFVEVRFMNINLLDQE